MSILIKKLFGKDMPMPQEGYVDIRLHFKGGRIECATMPIGNPPYYTTFKVIELPPHGRLIDADKFEFEMNDKLLVALTEKYGEEEAKKGLRFSFKDCISNIQYQPTVIEAEGSETE